MTTSQQIPFLSDVLSGEKIPAGKLAYFRARLTNRFHELFLRQFVTLSKEGKITRAQLAKRIGRKPEQLTRWLGSPGNWTIETFSDLLLGMGYEPMLFVSSLAEGRTNNITPPALANYVFPTDKTEQGSVEIVVSTGQLGITGSIATASSPSESIRAETNSALASAQPQKDYLERISAPQFHIFAGPLHQNKKLLENRV